ncbi:MAG: RluA family pseudouridine synthase [Candidatus Lindowbacteria bacterium]|nr:RluA family pseudouridine synthase [Candidatus Lindowbacteria bacterium]
MATTERTLTVSGEHAGTRLDQYVAAHVPELSRARAQALIHAGKALVNGEPVKPSHKVREGEAILVFMERVSRASVGAEDIPLDIVFEDDHIIVVNKPAGMVVHPAAGARSGTLVNALMAHSNQLARTGAAERPGIVHRLDKNTSGLLVVAKTDAAHRALTESISRRTVKRQYRALVYGNFAESSGTVDAPIGRCPSDRKKMAVTGVGSREAMTAFTVKESFPGAAHLEVQLSTGRTHQIRVHMTYIGHPIIGDTVYGVRLRRFHERMTPAVVQAIAELHSHMLHAEILEFEHPVLDGPMRFSAPLPYEFTNLLGVLREPIQNPK